MVLYFLFVCYFDNMLTFLQYNPVTHIQKYSVGDLTGSGLNSMGAGSLQLQMLPYPSTLLQKSFLLLFSSVSAQWHSASAGYNIKVFSDPHESL